MQFEVFTVPAGGGEAMAELNRFLSSHRVIGVEKHGTAERPLRRTFRAGGVEFLIFCWVNFSDVCRLKEIIL